MGWFSAISLSSALPLEPLATQPDRHSNGIRKPAPRIPQTDLDISQLGEDEIRWLRDAKFGMFIHWGLYAGPGRGEWLMHNEAIPPERYRLYASAESGEDYFAADRFDPRAWARVAKSAGMRWMCLTTRHHDGYCLFDSPHPNAFTSMQTHGRDLVHEYVTGCRREGLKVGIYYSPLSWRYPGYYDVTGTDCAKNPFGYVTDPAHKANARLMKEENYVNVHRLMTAYGKIDHIYWDGGWLAERGTDADGAFFHEPGKFLDPSNAWPIDPEWQDHDAQTGKPLGIMGMVRKHQPTAIANLRYGWMGDILEEEGGALVKGPVRSTALWDKCLTTAGAWGYDRSAIEKGQVMSPEQIITYLVNCVVRDMVMLLNVGPDRHGEIPAPVAKSLAEAGEWIHRAAPAIYGTRGGPWDPIDNQVGYCYRDRSVYVHLLSGYQGDSFTLPSAGSLKPVRAHEVLTGRRLRFTAQGDGSVAVSGIDRTFSPVDTIVSIEFDQPV